MNLKFVCTGSSTAEIIDEYLVPLIEEMGFTWAIENPVMWRNNWFCFCTRYFLNFSTNLCVLTWICLAFLLAL